MGFVRARMLWQLKRTCPFRTWNSSRRPESWTCQRLVSHSLVGDMDSERPPVQWSSVVAAAVAVGLEPVVVNV